MAAIRVFQGEVLWLTLAFLLLEGKESAVKPLLEISFGEELAPLQLQFRRPFVIFK